MRHLIRILTLTATIAAAAAADQWWRGNTHAHTSVVHGDSTPSAVATWYLDHGYHFLVLSEHDVLIDPAKVTLPASRRKDFILIPGIEISAAKVVHMTAFNVSQMVEGVTGKPIVEIIQEQSDATRAAGGIPMVNHPNHKWSVTKEDIRPVARCYLFELFNAHPDCNNDGDGKHPSTEAIWDYLLTDGMVMYGVSSDDVHSLKVVDRKHSNPGRGWVMVRAPELTATSLAAAFERGDFYASSGVHLAEVACDTKEYRVAADEKRTLDELAQGIVVTRIVPAKERSRTPPGWRIDFIGPGGTIVASENGLRAACRRDPNRAYLRAHITYTRQDGERLEQVSAWTQPVFEDGRLAKESVASVRKGWETR
jgi:hypothetical protein